MAWMVLDGKQLGKSSEDDSRGGCINGESTSGCDYEEGSLGDCRSTRD